MEIIHTHDDGGFDWWVGCCREVISDWILGVFQSYRPWEREATCDPIFKRWCYFLGMPVMLVIQLNQYPRALLRKIKLMEFHDVVEYRNRSWCLWHLVEFWGIPHLGLDASLERGIRKQCFSGEWEQPVCLSSECTVEKQNQLRLDGEKCWNSVNWYFYPASLVIPVHIVLWTLCQANQFLNLFLCLL